MHDLARDSRATNVCFLINSPASCPSAFHHVGPFTIEEADGRKQTFGFRPQGGHLHHVAMSRKLSLVRQLLVLVSNGLWRARRLVLSGEGTLLRCLVRQHVEKRS
jgi:hypothetical protein